MSKKVVAIVGTYRRRGITDQTVTAMLEAAREKGAETTKIDLLDKNIEFCTNCRTCTQEPGTAHGRCVHNDDMEQILAEIECADAIILASPVNFFNVTALMKRFIERLVAYSYWPWEKPMPKKRTDKLARRAVVVTSSACPAFIGRILMPGALGLLKKTANLMGAKVVRSVYFGTACLTEHQKLSEKQIQKARAAGALLVK
ncbi:MAG: flavodoxin family protein [Phycisphaerales bacterium]|nr:MAG: flavodoxin family protein [Phycisphaerales bacterium]